MNKNCRDFLEEQLKDPEFKAAWLWATHEEYNEHCSVCTLKAECGKTSGCDGEESGSLEEIQFEIDDELYQELFRLCIGYGITVECFTVHFLHWVQEHSQKVREWLTDILSVRPV